MVNIIYSKKAMEDIQLISDYLLSNWGETVAKKVLNKMTSDIRNLELFPLSGVSVAKKLNVHTEVRYLFSEKNYIFYLFKQDQIAIVRILNERQDYMEKLFE